VAANRCDRAIQAVPRAGHILSELMQEEWAQSALPRPSGGPGIALFEAILFDSEKNEKGVGFLFLQSTLENLISLNIREKKWREDPHLKRAT